MSKTQTEPEVRAQSVHDWLCENRDLAIEAAQSGVYAYAFGACDSMLVGEALMLSLESPEEAAKAICEKLDNQIVSQDQLDDTIKHFFFMYGIYKSFLARCDGKYKKGGKNE